MGWGALIAVIIELFGPVLADWLKKLLEQWLRQAAESATLSEPDPAMMAAENISLLFDAAIDRMPRLAFVRRNFLRSCKRAALARANQLMHAAQGGGSPTQLFPGERDELRDAAGAVADDLVG